MATLNDKRIVGKVAIVTGAAAGIGRSIALKLAKEGAKVCITDINIEGGEDCLNEIQSMGSEATFIAHDVADEIQWNQVICHTLEQYGHLDILVNNAGIAFAASIENTTTEEWRKIVSVNIDGVFFGCKFGISALRKSGGGSIVNISSILGITGTPYQAAYSATKGAVRMLTKSVALECAEAGWDIRINSVHPAYIRTPLVERYAETFGSLDIGLKELGKLHPLGHIGEAEEVANAVLFLVSSDSQFITGTELIIDGGYSAG